MTNALVNKVKMNNAKLNVYKKVLQEACELSRPYIKNKVNLKNNLYNTSLLPHFVLNKVSENFLSTLIKPLGWIKWILEYLLNFSPQVIYQVIWKV